MTYKNAEFCVNCKEELTKHEIMYSNGRCPKCGYKGENAVTICDTFERGYRLVRKYPFWMFWEKSEREYI